MGCGLDAFHVDAAACDGWWELASMSLLWRVQEMMSVTLKTLRVGSLSSQTLFCVVDVAGIGHDVYPYLALFSC